MTNQEAISIVKSVFDGHGPSEITISNQALDLAIKALKDARPQGEWLKNCENCDCNHCYESGHRFTRKDCSGTCSVCGVYSCCTDNYCPNCGAKMYLTGDPK